MRGLDNAKLFSLLCSSQLSPRGSHIRTKIHFSESYLAQVLPLQLSYCHESLSSDLQYHHQDIFRTDTIMADETKLITVADRIKGGVVGVCVADALGGPVQFKERGTFKQVTGFKYITQFDMPGG